MRRTKEIFVENLRHLRESRGYTQASFAEKVGFSVRGYQKYEQGQTEVTPEILDLFASALECGPKELILDKNSPNDKADLVLGIIAFLPSLDETELRAILESIADMRPDLAAIARAE